MEPLFHSFFLSLFYWQHSLARYFDHISLIKNPLTHGLTNQNAGRGRVEGRKCSVERAEMESTILVSVPPASSSHFSHQTHLFKAVKYSQLPPSVPSNLTLKNPSNLIPLCSSSSIPLVDKEEVSSAEEGGVSVQPQPPNMPSDNASLRFHSPLSGS